MLTAREAARLLRLKPETLAMKARNGEIPSVEIGRAGYSDKIQLSGCWKGDSARGSQAEA